MVELFDIFEAGILVCEGDDLNILKMNILMKNKILANI